MNVILYFACLAVVCGGGWFLVKRIRTRRLNEMLSDKEQLKCLDALIDNCERSRALLAEELKILRKGRRRLVARMVDDLSRHSWYSSRNQG